MNIAKQLHWSIIVGSELQRQLVFYIDRPTYHFPTIKEERGGKEIWVPSGAKPSWDPIVIEFPLQLLPHTALWLKEKSKRDMQIFCMDPHGKLLERWQIKGIVPISQQEKMGRSTINKVLHVVGKFEWARAVK